MKKIVKEVYNKKITEYEKHNKLYYDKKLTINFR